MRAIVIPRRRSRLDLPVIELTCDTSFEFHPAAASTSTLGGKKIINHHTAKAKKGPPSGLRCCSLGQKQSHNCTTHIPPPPHLFRCTCSKFAVPRPRKTRLTLFHHCHLLSPLVGPAEHITSAAARQTSRTLPTYVTWGREK